MADPKMLTATDLADYRSKANGNSGSAAGWWDEDINALLSHIAAQDAAIAAKDAEIAKLQAAVRAGDDLGTPVELCADAKSYLCTSCHGWWKAGAEERHKGNCVWIVYRTARAAVKLEGDDAKG